jgi:hypothetical protein
MRQLVIVGTGAVAAEITSYLEEPQYMATYDVKIKGYLDIDNTHISKYSYKNPYLGNVEDYTVKEDDFFIIAIGNNKYRREYAEKIIQKKKNL